MVTVGKLAIGVDYIVYILTIKEIIGRYSPKDISKKRTFVHCSGMAAPRCSSDKIAHHSALTLPTFRWPSSIVWLQKMDVLFGSSGQQPAS